MVVPVGEPVHVLLTSDDVIHSFYVPAFLFKRDAIPGHPTEFDFTVDEPGGYGGQCAEFCGVYHDRMLLTVRAVTRPEFESWLAGHAAPSGSPARSCGIAGRFGTGRPPRPRRHRPPPPHRLRHERHGASRAGDPPPRPAASGGGRPDRVAHHDRSQADRRRSTCSSAFVMFLVGGAAGGGDADRAQPRPASSWTSSEEDAYDQLFTMHGTIMLLLFVGRRSPSAWRTTSSRSRSAREDMAFPRLNALSLLAVRCSAALVDAERLPGPAGGRGRRPGGTAYVPAAATRPASTGARRRPLDRRARPRRASQGCSRAVNFVATIYTMRAPGHDRCSGCRSSPGTSSSPR